MQCFVYRSKNKSDTYIFLTAKDKFKVVPEELLKLFGDPEFALEFNLTEDRKLAIADSKQVLLNLQEQGYYLQMPSQNKLPV